MTVLAPFGQTEWMFSRLLSFPQFQFNRKIRSQVFLSHMVLAGGVGLVSMTGFYFLAKQALIGRAVQQLQSISNLKRLKIEALVASYRRYAASSASMLWENGASRLKSGQDAAAYLNEVPFQKEVFRFLTVNQKGEVKFDTLPEAGLPPEVFSIAPAQLGDSGVGSFVLDSQCDIGTHYAPCLWVGAKSRHGAVAFQLRMNAFAELLTLPVSLGATGESYLIGKDRKFRSPSRFLSDEHAYKTEVHSFPVLQGQLGKSGVVDTEDYRSVKVLSAFTPLEGIPGFVLLTEVDKDEVLLALSSMRQAIALGAAALIVLVFLYARFYSARLSKPLESQFEAFRSDLVFQRLHQRALYDGQEIERKRVAAELHDGVGQELVAFDLMVASLDLDPSEKSRISQRVTKVSEAIRRICRDLVPQELSQLGFIPALTQLCRTSTESSSIVFHLDVPELLRNRFGSGMFERNVYRIFQESVTNVLKHSGATQCTLHIKESGAHWVFSVEDNGKGIVGETFGKGMVNMKQRTESLGGVFKVESDRTNGTKLEITIPQSSMSWEKERV
jgi:signal transduction histidine kinase